MNPTYTLERELAELEQNYARQLRAGKTGGMSILLCALWAIIGGLTVYSVMTW